MVKICAYCKHYVSEAEYYNDAKVPGTSGRCYKGNPGSFVYACKDEDETCDSWEISNKYKEKE